MPLAGCSGEGACACRGASFHADRVCPPDVAPLNLEAIAGCTVGGYQFGDRVFHIALCLRAIRQNLHGGLENRTSVPVFEDERKKHTRL